MSGGWNWGYKGLSGLWNLLVRKDSGPDSQPRRRLNLIEGSNISLTVADSAPFNEVQVTITATAGVSPVGAALPSGDIWVGSAGNLAAAVAVTGNVTISNAGVTTIGAGVVTNAMLAGSIATSKLTDGSLFIKSDGSVAFAANQSLGSHKLTSVTDPTAAQDAATKNYVDMAVAALSAKDDVQAATTTGLAAYTYNNGSAGVGATITLTVAAVLVLDGYTPTLNDRLLIKNETSTNTPYNGIYYLSQVGVLGVTQAVLTRTTDFDQPSDGINGALVFVNQGTVNGKTLWFCTATGTITFGTTNINFSQFTGTTYTADETTLHLSGTTFSILSTYTGQTSITTLGTIATGTWAGTTITVNHGGSGAATFTAFAVLCAGTTSTGAFQNVSGVGTSGQVLTSNGAGALPTWQTGVAGQAYPTGYYSGFGLTFGSTTTILVAKGTARDSTDAANISPAAATITWGSAGFNGNDRVTIAGTVSTNASSAVTGSGTSFTTAFGTRALSAGTIGTSGSSTTITGTSTKFLTDCYLEDLIGISGGPFARITAIASDTSLTVSQAITIAGGSSGLVIEQPTFSVAGDHTGTAVDKITSNTSLLLANSLANTGSGLTATVGDIGGFVLATFWANIWAGQDAAGTNGFFASTQRTTPYVFANSGHNLTYWRLVGVWPLTGGGLSIVGEWLQGSGPDRTFRYELPVNSVRFASNVSPTVWTAYDPSQWLPPNAKSFRFSVIAEPTATLIAYFRTSTAGASTTTRGLLMDLSANVRYTTYFDLCGLGTAHLIDAVAAANANLYFEVVSFNMSF